MQAITVYLQALGAHFLGAHAYNKEEIIVNLVYSGGTLNLPYRFPAGSTGANQNDGKNTATFSDGLSSFVPIITVSASPNVTTQLNYLTPDADTICATGSFTRPTNMELAHLDISVPVTSSSNLIHIKYPVLLSPQRSIYTIVVAVPGLYISKPTFTKGSGTTDSTIAVLVKMMCGCPITNRDQNPPSLWHPSDFDVLATVYDSLGVNEYQLNYTLSGQFPNSLFMASIPQSINPSYIIFSAIQKSTNNYGQVQLDII